MPPYRACDRPFAACQDGVLCIRSEPRPHRLRHRQWGGIRSGSRTRVVLARRRASRRGRSSRGIVYGERGPTCDEERRDHRARGARTGRCGSDGLDLRFLARLRQHQRRLSELELISAAELGELFARLEKILDRVEGVLPAPAPPPDWRATAFRWRRRTGRGYLQAIGHPHSIRLDDLVAVDEQKRAIDANTRQFVAGLPANNVLLTGSRGTGKSSLIKAMLVKYSAKGLRLIEVDKADLVELPDIAEIVGGRRERFIVYCDDLTFDAGEPGYKALKVMLDGTVAAPSANMLIYATSNRRHLMPEYFSENLETRHVGEEVHPGESVEEKISLSERFGLWISFYPFSQDDYLAAVESWLDFHGVPPSRDASSREALHRDAIQFSLQRGSRSGRVAWQFARARAGARALK